MKVPTPAPQHPLLSASHQHTYDAIFRHPVAHNLDQRDVRSLLNAIADVAEQPNGNVKVTRNGQTLVLHPSSQKHVGEEIGELRDFLERSGVPSASAVPDGMHLLVVIDHREARVYQAEVHGTMPERLTPYDPRGRGRYLHSVSPNADGQRVPEQSAYYESVARTLEGAEKVVIFGSGTGASSAMDELTAHLKKHHPEIARRVVCTRVVDDHHLTDDELLAAARGVYATL